MAHALARGAAGGADAGVGNGLTWAPSLTRSQGDLEAAEALGQEAVAARRELGDLAALGLALITPRR